MKLARAGRTGDKGRDGLPCCEDVLTSMASNQGDPVRSLDSLKEKLLPCILADGIEQASPWDLSRASLRAWEKPTPKDMEVTVGLIAFLPTNPWSW